MAQFNRREFARLAAMLPALPGLRKAKDLGYAGGLTDIPGIRVGHFTDPRRPTGCTVILTERGAVAAVDVRGSAPGTRETDLLAPNKTIQKIHAIVLAGGSAFGLDSASGVVQYLEERGVGFQTRRGPVPIVPAAILYDLGLGDPSIRPDREAGYRACQRAHTGPVQEGNVGAGAGATVGKMLGADRAMKAGLGSAALRVDRLTVAALVAVNAVGDVVDPESGQILAGARSKDGKSFVDLAKILRTTTLTGSPNSLENTTLGVVATNAAFDKPAMHKIAEMSHDGLARTIHPVHLPFDGDTIFSISTGEEKGCDLGQVGALAAQLISQAVIRSVLQARGIPGYPAHSDL
ncbi:MAG: P1 family peptidase [Acidobacteriota bacterium]